MEMEDRINQLISEENADRDRADTFADRADAYYRRRPRLISLLQDLYNDYVSLADRYTRALTKLNTGHNNHQYRHPSPSPPPSCFDDAASFSDAESTLSFQPTKSLKSVSTSSIVLVGAGADAKDTKLNVSTKSVICGGTEFDAAAAVVAELVIRNVEYEFLKNEMEAVTRESCRKIELQSSLVEVLESERLVLLGENSRLVYKAEILAEERNGVVSENAFLRTRANQLAKCVMRLEEERRGVVLGRQIEDLQRQIYALEMKRKNDGVVEKCFCSGSENAPPHTAENMVGRGGGKLSGWWRKLKKIGSGPCGCCISVGQVVVKESK